MAQISPDGARVAFSSGRSGLREIWITDIDGKNPMQLTALGSRLTTNPSWSPDSRQLAFDSRSEGFSEIFTIDVRGGAPRRLTRGPAEQMFPFWSQDGKWIYFQSGTGGYWDIWKTLATGGDTPMQITHQGGGFPKEAPDGRTVYYAKDEKIWSVPASGGREEPVSGEQIDEYNFAVTGTGVYFIPAAGTPHRYSIRLLRFSTGKVEQVLALEKSPGLGLTVAPNERWLLYAQYDQEGSDLMLLENFR
jgi:dipeptidyl aminopeptidase/acylaminoacyl peptidase